MESHAHHAVFFDVSGTLLESHPAQVLGVQICRDAQSVLQKCRNRSFAGIKVRTGVITNWGQRVHSLFRTLGIEDCFDFVIHAQSYGVLKPDPLVFQRACELVGLGAKQCLHVGDSLYHDAVGAQRAGLHGLWLERDLAAFHGLSERSLIASLRLEPILSLDELEGVFEGLFAKNLRIKIRPGS